VCVGRLSAEKGFDRAIRATADLVGRGHDVRLRILGDGDARVDLARLAAELGIADRVELLGEVPHSAVPGHVQDATVVVMPSHVEGLPLVALEAAAMARPVVGMAVPGLSEAVVDGRTGILVDVDEHLAEAIAALLADRERARALGTAARERVERSFSLEACVDGYLRVYDRLVSPGTV
jgi:glycosyltransferase involved in cell wall biosynthesis